MADKWLVKNGNTSDPTTWNDGTLPGATDDCYADGFTGTIDADLTVASVRTEQRTGGTAGGGWVLPGGVTLTADVYAGTTDCVTFSAPSPAEATIVGSSYGSTTDNNTAAVVHAGTGTLNVVGDMVGRSSTTRLAYRHAISGTLLMTGDVIANGGRATQIDDGAILHITGNLVGLAHVALECSGASTITITGDIMGGGNNNAYGLYTAANVALHHIGTVTAGLYQSAIHSMSTGATNILSGPLINADGVMAFCGRRMFLMEGATSWTFATLDLLTDRTLYSADTLPGQPAESDVRKDTVYGPSGELTGTLAVPPASAVGVGVPVDNTVGTAAVTTAAIQAALTSQGLTEARAGYLDKLNVAGELANTDNADSFKATGFAVPGSAMTLTSDERNAVADTVFSRDVANAESSAAEHSLCTIVLASLESSISGTTWTIKRTDGETTHAIKTLTTDKTADPITGVS
jgi:hypothetical protein